ncbi:Arsenical-resistance protein Acr3 [bioreactor metagenome]|jgi:ACR3 family arsenite transporter|uniref:ACR3 family arsenite efflux transporter n=5 Tax=root TaxID=1 RepID=A0A8J7VZ88_9FIRM|nr:MULTISPECIES: ACR3 family arsenite efflux transporter [Bacillota]MEA5084128.1 ACR3 family arsenite efflux transporter [Lachnospiraceae bacterium]HWQ73799.1 ACR3 family arsenite efflux transporter [Syntrophomonas sp.]ADY54405.1 arsenical-resistance protein [Syntrophobotulus glycolicus DSM 8271]MBR0596266.1 ACR3 family arsenite efflux transporter [Sinanaerobacter chloroacetimidivorans]QEY35010.1 ACR3 family arsenite efflux transporter [Caproiciproducens galactitolivorans]
MSQEKNKGIGFFEKYLTVWVLLCMAAGILVGKFLPGIPDVLEGFQYAGQNLPIAVLIWIMIFPMMMKIDFQSIKNVRKNPSGILISSGSSWLIKPFLMFGLATLFFKVIFQAFIPADLAQDFVTGAVLLGVAPCTAMVFVWSHLTKGDPAHTLVQVSVNDLLILVLFVPLVQILLGVNGVTIPWDTLFFSIVLFVVVPLAGGALTRFLMIQKKGIEYFNERFLPKFDGITTLGLLLTLIIIFSFQGDIILEQPLFVLLIAVPLVLQNVISANFTYLICKWTKQPHNIAAPASLIAASDFFELSVAVAIALFGPNSPVVLACTVGVLTEVPVMLLLVRFINKTHHWFLKEV